MVKKMRLAAGQFIVRVGLRVAFGSRDNYTDVILTKPQEAGQPATYGPITK